MQSMNPMEIDQVAGAALPLSEIAASAVLSMSALGRVDHPGIADYAAAHSAIRQDELRRLQEQKSLALGDAVTASLR